LMLLITRATSFGALGADPATGPGAQGLVTS
jgi:hypothetical protein